MQLIFVTGGARNGKSAYADALGAANQRSAAAAEEVVFLVSGLPLLVKPAAVNPAVR